MKDTDEELLDDWLNTHKIAPASLTLQQRILSIAKPANPLRELLALLGGWQIAGPAFALSLSLGVCTSLWVGQTNTVSASQDSVWTLAGLDTAQEWSYE